MHRLWDPVRGVRCEMCWILMVPAQRSGRFLLSANQGAVSWALGQGSAGLGRAREGTAGLDWSRVEWSGVEDLRIECVHVMDVDDFVLVVAASFCKGGGDLGA
ncbi:unnamed protein product [Calypogeia fissa]